MIIITTTTIIITYISYQNKKRFTEDRLVVAKAGGSEEVGKGRIGSLGLADVNCHVQDG